MNGVTEESGAKPQDEGLHFQDDEEEDDDAGFYPRELPEHACKSVFESVLCPQLTGADLSRVHTNLKKSQKPQNDI